MFSDGKTVSFFVGSSEIQARVCRMGDWKEDMDTPRFHSLLLLSSRPLYLLSLPFYLQAMKKTYLVYNVYYSLFYIYQ